MDLTAEQHQQLIDQGWTPPPDTAGMLAAERERITSGSNVLGGGEGDTTPIYLLVQERTDFVIAVERSTYDLFAETDDLPELLDDRPDDYRTTTYTLLDA
ncbi:hypothetical protein [Streptomonospora arabica]|uniref:Uncharacterized protein n=1 Tax=Streptomonospora arabica TaxID=412417 RepID=A0ABV9SSF8_9ACTN